VSISAIFEILNFPLEFHRQFVLEEVFGFNKMNLKLYIMDKIKQTILSIVLSLPLLWGLITFLEKTGNLWWLYAWGAFVCFQMIIYFLYPVVIAPIFNKFTPLEEGELRQRLEDLSKKCGFTNQGIFMMDGSKRSSHSNAYFTGFGRFRRIVLFDTLIEQLTIDQLEGVLAHEIGHYKKRHILKRMVSSMFIMGIFFFLLHLLKDQAALYQAFRFSGPSLEALLIIIGFCSSPIGFLFTPINTGRSRKHEFQADSYSYEIVGSAEPLIGALLGLSKKNLSNLTPHPLYSNFYYSHPTLAERRSALLKLQGTSDDKPPEN
ncbi:MAG: M48 family metallopeptidase, partial [Spirochaetaceae bacterium]|nr:M48 family metallopeptidase [Spirochaetaceae bacterium]